MGLIALFSFLPAYSASSNLVYLYGHGSTLRYLFKHALLLLGGGGILYFAQRLNHRYYSGLSVIGLPLVVVLLIATLLQGATIGGVNASRWIEIPVVQLSFQTSSLAILVMMAYTARYLSKIRDDPPPFKEVLIRLFAPVSLVCALILSANFSTAAMLFAMVLILLFIGGLPYGHLGLVLLISALGLLLFLLSAKAFPELMPNRVDTWMHRIENFSDSKGDPYQRARAKVAITSGGLFGVGPGKSSQKDFLPQSASDFIFAIVVEEYGLIGGTAILALFMLFFTRILIIATKMPDFFGSLLVISMGLPIVFQSFVNIGVAVGMLPITGQNLPLISSGGTSLWMTCLEIGIILSASRAYGEEEKEKPLRTQMR